jgi:uncharacterized protein (DUF952 family)
MEWGTYLARGVQPPIYHMCDAAQFTEATSAGGMYFSPTFAADKFIHATADPQFLLEAGNHFYKAVVGDWICIKLEPSLLGGPVVYEAPAPVGDIEAFDYVKAPKFPHIYGGIPKKSVLQTFKIIRGEDGSFLSIEGLI